jgi:hypothetical protein
LDDGELHKTSPKHFNSFACVATQSRQLIAENQQLESTLHCIHLSPSKLSEDDLELISPYLGYRPLDIVHKTLENTTQLACTIWRFPLRKHVKARFPFLNHVRLAESVSMDTIFAVVPAIGRCTCAQIFYGITSHMINVYGMKAESEVPKAYQDFMHNEGIPSLLRRDMSKAQMSDKISTLNCDNIVKDAWSEPYHQQQNPVEINAVWWLKTNMQVLMDRSGAPDSEWLTCIEYLADVHNIVADESLNFQTPLYKCTGSIPNISAYLHFHYYQLVLCLDSEVSFPASKEIYARWVGVAQHIGDALMYKLRNPETGKILYRSIVPPADDPVHPNHCLVQPKDVHPLNGETTFDENGERSATGEALPLSIPLPAPISSQKSLPIDIVHDLNNMNKKKLRRLAHRSPKVPVVHFKDPIVTDDALHIPPETSMDDISDGNPPCVSPSLRTPILSGAVAGEMDPGNMFSGEETTSNDVPVTKPAYNLRPRQPLHALLAMGLVAIGAVSFFHSDQAQAVEFAGPDITNLPSIEPETFDIMLLSANNRKQLWYLQLCDNAMDDLADTDDAQWKVLKVLEHKISKKPHIKSNKVTVASRHLHLRVQWLNGTNSWIQEAGLQADNPFPLIHYAIKMELLAHPDFSWTAEYADDATALTEMKHAFAAKQQGPKFKFGVQVPVSPKHALALDEACGNKLWKEAIDKELKQINEYETFRTLANGEMLSVDY